MNRSEEVEVEVVGVEAGAKAEEIGVTVAAAIVVEVEAEVEVEGEGEGDASVNPLGTAVGEDMIEATTGLYVKIAGDDTDSGIEGSIEETEELEAREVEEVEGETRVGVAVGVIVGVIVGAEVVGDAGEVGEVATTGTRTGEERIGG